MRGRIVPARPSRISRVRYSAVSSLTNRSTEDGSSAAAISADRCSRVKNARRSTPVERRSSRSSTRASAFARVHGP